MKLKSAYIFIVLLLGITIISCKNDHAGSAGTSSPASAPKTATTSSGDISKFENLDHDFNIIPEGSKVFVKGFFNNSLSENVVTINKGMIHAKGGVLTVAEFNLDMKTLDMIANKDQNAINNLKSLFEVSKFPDAKIKVDECIKAVNDQQATHILSGHIELKGKSVPFKIRSRIDYSAKNLTVTAEPIIIKASEIGIKPADPSQENLYFNITINGLIL